MSDHLPLAESTHSGEKSSVASPETAGAMGAGVMGVGLAHVFAQSGLRPLLIDVSDAVLESALERIRNSTRFQRSFKKNAGDAPDRLTSIPADADYVKEEC